MDQPKQTKKKHLLLTTNQPTRSDELLITAVLIALLLLIGIVGLLWSTWNRVVLAPTATPTATTFQTITSTPDLPATRNFVLLETQTTIAQQVAQLGATETSVAESLLTVAAAQIAAATGTPDVAQSSQISTTPSIDPSQSITLTEVAVITDTDTSSTTSVISVPLINTGGGTTGELLAPEMVITMTVTEVNAITAQATVTLTTAIVNNAAPKIQPRGTTTISVPIIIVNEPIPATPTVSESDAGETLNSAELTATPVLTATSVITPTATPLPPTETPTPTFTPTPTRFVVSQLDAVVRENETKLRSAPGGSENGQLTQNYGVTLRSRNTTGEWINVCCLNGQVGWVRQSELDIAGNIFEDGGPADADPNDVRWLNIDAGANAPPSQVAPIPPGTYPLLRGNTANHGAVGQLPVSLTSNIWQIQNRQGLASANFISPITISSNAIFASTEDSTLFSFNKETGNIRWRWQYAGGRVTKAAALKDNQLYLVDDSGTLYNIEDRNTSIEEKWRVALKTGDQDDSLALTPVTNIALQDNCLYLGAKSNDAHYVVSIRQDNGFFCFTAKSVDGSAMQHISLGGRLIFVSTNRGIFAKDVSSGDPVWGEVDKYKDISAPPVYGYPGIDSLAELYIARNGGDLIALNANTGAELWTFASGETITGMAIDDKHLYVTGNGFIKVISRAEHGQIASIGINGSVPVGPLLSSTHLLALTDFGDMYIVDSATQELEFSQPTDSSGIRHFVVNGSTVYFHNGGTALRALRSQ